MSYAATAYLLIFCSSFVVVFLLGLQSKNVNQGRYVAAMLTSLGISVSQFVFVKYAAVGSLDVLFVSAAGGVLGIASSMWFHRHVIEKRFKAKS